MFLLLFPQTNYRNKITWIMSGESNLSVIEAILEKKHVVIRSNVDVKLTFKREQNYLPSSVMV